MTTAFSSPCAAPTRLNTAALPAVSAPRKSSGALTATLCCLALLVVGGPLFVRMPLTNDAMLFDLQARLLSEGSTPYRDVLEPNLPGVVWVHAAVRTLCGPSSEALRLFDLAVYCTSLALGGLWLRSAGGSARGAWWWGAAALLYYLSISEWCHCQRDTWMLLPALAAVSLRQRRTSAWFSMNTPVGSVRELGGALLEGMLWGTAVWIKPYAVLPGLACWVVTHRLVRRRRLLLLDTAGLLAGGLLVGATGVTWLIDSGAWPAFYDTLTRWNPRYFQAGREHWTLPRFVAMTIRLWPWSILHLFAVPIAAASAWRVLRPDSSIRRSDAARHRQPSAPLLAALYLAWCSHAFVLQHLFDYVHVPGQVLALLVVACRLATETSPGRQRTWRAAVYSLAVMAVLASPLVRADTLRLWPRCVTGPNSPRLQDHLAHFENPNREDLARVGTFLRRHGVRDGDVCCYNSDLVSLYQSLGLRPPTRFVYLHELLIFFPERSSEIGAALEQSGHRYVVTDLAACGLSRPQALEIGLDGPLAPPPAFQGLPADRYPWSQPVVFRAGAYLVHRVERPLGPVSVRSAPR